MLHMSGADCVMALRMAEDMLVPSGPGDTSEAAG